MTYLPRLPSQRTAGWSDLRDELDRWEEAGCVATLWWRDDDAVQTTPQLDRLLDIAGDTALALAVIPDLAEASLPAGVDRRPNIAVVQHGWRHANHAVAGKKSEYPATRNPTDVASELAAGARRLSSLFGPRFVPILAPPWNRFAAEFLPLLRPAGIDALSVMEGDVTAIGESGVAMVDAHVDLVAWRSGRGFIGTETALGLLVAHLRGRRLSATDPAAATGILTHHLVLDDATAVFLRQLLTVVDRHGAGRWVEPDELRKRV